jgi:hypothetical protein
VWVQWAFGTLFNCNCLTTNEHEKAGSRSDIIIIYMNKIILLTHLLPTRAGEEKGGGEFVCLSPILAFPPQGGRNGKQIFFSFVSFRG